MRVPEDFKGKFNLELVLKFDGPGGLDTLTATKRLIDLPLVAAAKNTRNIFMLAMQYEKLKDYKKLIDVYEEGLKLHPENPILLNAYAWMLATAEDEKFMNPGKAEKLARKAVKLTNENNGAILDTLAVALYKQGRLTEAVKYSKMAAEKCPSIREAVDRAKQYEKELEKKK